MPIERNCFSETVFEAKARFSRAGKLSRYFQLMKKYKNSGMEPMEAFKEVCIAKEMRPEQTDKLIEFRKKTGRIE